MNNLSVKQVRDNLHEMLWGAQNNKPIMGNRSGTKVYSVVWYRWVVSLLMSGIYRMTEIIWSLKNVKEQKLCSAVQKTEEAFRVCLLDLEAKSKQYNQILEAKCRGQLVNADEEKECMRVIKDWNNYMQPILRMPMRDLLAKINRLHPLALPLPNNIADQVDRSALILAQAAKQQKLIDLESSINLPIPFALFLKIGSSRIIPAKERDMVLTNEEKADVFKWVKAGRKLKVKQLDEGLRAFVRLVPKFERNAALPELEKPSLASLEWCLQQDYGCKVFNQPDPEIMRVREDLDKGVTQAINSSERTVRIAERLGIRKLNMEDKHVVYNTSNPDEVVKIGINCAELRIEQEDARRNPMDGIRLVNTQVDEDGLFALMEKMEQPLSVSRPSGEDRTKIMKFIEFLSIAIEKDNVPFNLSLDTLWLNRNKDLVTTKVPKKGPKDLHTLAKIIEAYSGNNKEIFRTIIVGLKMQDSQVSKYLLECLKIELGLLNDGNTLENIAATYGVIRSALIDVRVAKLQENVRAMRERCEERIILQYHIPDTNLLRASISRSIVKEFEMYSLELTEELLKTVDEDVIASVLGNERYISKKSDDEIAQEVVKLAREKKIEIREGRIPRDGFHLVGVYYPDQYLRIMPLVERALQNSTA